MRKKFEIISSDDAPEALNHDDPERLWVVSRRVLQHVATGEEIAEWTRCAVGSYDERGAWSVEEDTEGGDVLPEHVADILAALGLDDEIPNVPEPEMETDDDPDGEWACYWSTTLDDAGPRSRHATREGAEAAVRKTKVETTLGNVLERVRDRVGRRVKKERVG